jgi:hypothetical protein
MVDSGDLNIIQLKFPNNREEEVKIAGMSSVKDSMS